MFFDAYYNVYDIFCCFNLGYADFTSKEERKEALGLSCTEFYGRELNINVANKTSGGGGRGTSGGQPTH